MAKKVVIVGGVAGGASAAARLRRLDEDAEIIMFERGLHISFANCGLPYYIGDIIPDRKRLLVQTPERMQARFNIDVRTLSEVTRILPSQKEVEVCDLSSDETYRESYDYLIISPGAFPLVPDLPGIDLSNVFKIRNVPDSDTVKKYIQEQEPETAVVLGGGFIGLEMADVLHESGVETAVVEASSQIMGPLDAEMAAIVQNYLRWQGIDLYLADRAAALEGTDRVEKVVLESGRTIPADMVVLGIGVRPEVGLAQEAGLALGSTGGILVDEYLRTSDPFIYAVGDAIQVRDFVTGRDVLVPLAGPANRQGRLVADNIAGYPTRYGEVQGTAIVKILDMAAAVTGSNEKSLTREGRDFLTCHLHPSSHATYYPGSTQMSMKLLFTPGEGKVLGAQIVGYNGVDKRIDVLATAIRAGMTVFDLQELELAYAPPFGSAKDPVNLAGYVASNMLKGDVEMAYWPEVPEFVAAGAVLLDVRTSREFSRGAVEGAMHVPVDNLREQLELIPRDKEILVYCRTGLRSYIAARILSQHGYRCKNISGGYELYRAAYQTEDS
jgi:NADPH-dependent 2,4-dienoyl-CoA reductase/sulfur reductase-like enzyme/rhodanese-related sulfurtransferase